MKRILILYCFAQSSYNLWGNVSVFVQFNCTENLCYFGHLFEWTFKSNWILLYFVCNKIIEKYFRPFQMPNGGPHYRNCTLSRLLGRPSITAICSKYVRGPGGETFPFPIYITLPYQPYRAWDMEQSLNEKVWMKEKKSCKMCNQLYIRLNCNINFCEIDNWCKFGLYRADYF